MAPWTPFPSPAPNTPQFSSPSHVCLLGSPQHLGAVPLTKSLDTPDMEIYDSGGDARPATAGPKNRKTIFSARTRNFPKVLWF